MCRDFVQALRGRALRLAVFPAAALYFIGLNSTPAAAQCFLSVYPFACPTATSYFLQSLGRYAQETSQIELTGLQQQIWGIEDYLQGKHVAPPRPMGFAEEAADDPAIDSAFAALGYSGEQRDPKSPIAVKAPPAAEPSRFSFAAWTQGYIDHENRVGTFDGIDIGRNTLTGGGLAGADVTIQGLTTAGDALVLGLVTGDVTARIDNADGSIASVRGPSLGTYGAYVNGAFSVDGTFKVDFLNLADTAALTPPFTTNITSLGLDNYVTAGNINYKYDFGSWWIQPTAGANETRTVWNSSSQALGMIDGTDVRVQAGARLGSGFDWAGIHFSETLTLLAYDDVIISGGTLAVATGVPLAPTDEGKMFGQAIGKLEAHLTKNWLLNAEGELRGRNDVYGIAGRLGATYLFD